MNREQFDVWLTKLGKAWEERDPQKAASLFARDVVYYESPFSEPCSNWEEVLKLWLVVPKNQKNVTFKHEIIFVSEKLGLVHWKVSRIKLPSNEKEHIDGVFLASLNDEDLCTLFKQWRATKIG